MRRNKTVTIMAVTFLIMSMLLFTAIAQNVNTDQELTSGTSQGSVLWQAIGGMTGEITTEIKLVDQTNTGSPDTVLIGTDGGAMANIQDSRIFMWIINSTILILAIIWVISSFHSLTLRIYISRRHSRNRWGYLQAPTIWMYRLQNRIRVSSYPPYH